MAKAQDPPSPVDAYEAPPPPTPAGGPMPPQYAATPEYALTQPQSAPQYAQQYSAPARETNVLAIIALIASCVGFQIPGIVMGYIALSQIKKSGEGGHGLALAAVIVGWALLAVVIVLIVVYVVFIFFVIGIAGSAANDFGDFSNFG